MQIKIIQLHLLECDKCRKQLLTADEMNAGRGSEQTEGPENGYRRCTSNSERSWHCQKQHHLLRLNYQL